VDIEAGPGADVIANAHAFDSPERFDLVLCCEMLEHDTDPMATVAVCRRHLAAGGLLVITTPANGFPDHKYPRDYWRFMPDAYTDLFFSGMTILEAVEIEGPTLCGVAMMDDSTELHPPMYRH
jgi:2-polyprenyl-3-methyl-5-hydroxy-6-metoxy-1,4-benzoquinol methylase